MYIFPLPTTSPVIISSLFSSALYLIFETQKIINIISPRIIWSFVYLFWQQGTDPEPDGEEGMCDVRVVEALIKSLQTGQPQQLEPYTRHKRIVKEQVQDLRHVKLPEAKPELSYGLQQAVPAK
jgi:hypothetical protein